MRSFMKVHLRTSSNSSDSQVSDAQSPTKRSSSAHQFVKKSSTSVSNFFSSGPPEPPAVAASDGSDGSASPKRIRNVIKFPKHRSASSSNGPASPQVKQKASIGSLSSSGSLVLDIRKKKAPKRHSMDWDESDAPSPQSLESPATTIYGTKQHHWGDSRTSLRGVTSEASSEIVPPIMVTDLKPGGFAPPSLSPASLSSAKFSPVAYAPTEPASAKPEITAADPAKPVESPTQDLAPVKSVTFAKEEEVHNPEEVVVPAAGSADDHNNDDGDDVSSTSSSSQFSFQASGRNASIKYYKSRDQLDTEAAQDNEEKFRQFINSSEPLDHLDDEMNYIDLDEDDSTDDLFNRELFPIEPRSELKREVLPELSTSTPAEPAGAIVPEDPGKDDARLGEINQLLLQLQGATLSSTTSNGESKSADTPKVVRRVSSIKYHQLDNNFKEDNLKKISDKYSWLPQDSPASTALRVNASGSTSSLENSLLDEINEMPEEYDYESSIDNSDRRSDSVERSHSFRSGDGSLGTPHGSNQGNRINLDEKTITLFGPISPKQKMQRTEQWHQPPRYADILGAPLAEDLDDHDDPQILSNQEDDLNFVSRYAPGGLGECSFLTTISEASQEDSQSQSQIQSPYLR